MRQYIMLVERYLEDFNVEQFLERARGVMELVRRGAYEGERDAARLAFDRLKAHAKLEVKRMRMRNSGVTRDEVDRFLNALEQIATPKAAPPPPPPPEPIPKFKVDQWVVHTDDDSVGKITAHHFIHNQFVYDVNFSGTIDQVFEQHLRPATQNEINRSMKPRFAVGQWVVHTDDNSVGKVTTRWLNDGKFEYNIDFSGTIDQVFEYHLRSATQDEIDAAQAEAMQHKATDAFEIIAIASYVSLAENSNKVYGIVKHEGKIYTFWGGRNKALSSKQHDDPADAHQQYDSKIRKGYREMSSADLREIRPWVITALKARFAKFSPG